MKIQISKKRTASLNHLTQWPTYDTLLEGLPTKSLNKEMIASVLDKAKSQWKYFPIHLIPPKQSLASNGRDFMGEAHYELPHIACIG